MDSDLKKNSNKDTPYPLKRHGANMVEDTPWCVPCNLPHSLEYCVVVQSIQESEAPHDQDIDDHTINMLEIIPYEVNKEYSSLEC